MTWWNIILHQRLHSFNSFIHFRIMIIIWLMISSFCLYYFLNFFIVSLIPLNIAYALTVNYENINYFFFFFSSARSLAYPFYYIHLNFTSALLFVWKSYSKTFFYLFWSYRSHSLSWHHQHQICIFIVKCLYILLLIMIFICDNDTCDLLNITQMNQQQQHEAALIKFSYSCLCAIHEYSFIFIYLFLLVIVIFVMQ